ncbi:MAG: hypothetical protein JW910_08110 [Anaerolineae bacterium]|nr:hypothetical protein [Anaerolineae bacterium]
MFRFRVRREAEKQPDPVQSLDQLVQIMDADATFGTPVEKDGATLIPVVALHAGVAGPQSKNFRATARPLGFVHVTEAGVEFETIVNSTLALVVGLVVAAFSIFWIAQAIMSYAPKQPTAIEIERV